MLMAYDSKGYSRYSRHGKNTNEKVIIWKALLMLMENFN